MSTTGGALVININAKGYHEGQILAIGCRTDRCVNDGNWAVTAQKPGKIPVHLRSEHENEILPEQITENHSTFKVVNGWCP